MTPFTPVTDLRCPETAGSNNGWMPIDSAPRDGTQILAYGVYHWNDYDDRSRTGWAVIEWYVDDSYDDRTAYWVIATTNPYQDRMPSPIGWKPLDPPPAI